jgi:cytochrome c peroxidase
MKTCIRLVLTMAVLAAGGCASVGEEEGEQISSDRERLTLEERIALCQGDQRVQVGLVTVDVCVGADLFFRETFNGNGRSCATCHPVDHDFTIDPAFIATLPATDPLFVAETNPNLAKLEIPAVMRQFSLILENVDGFADPTRIFALRAVPHTLSLATSITNPSGTQTPAQVGWSGDGAPAPGELRDFQTGAINQHYPRTLSRVPGIDFRLATSGELDRIDRFMRQLGRLNELNLATVTVRDPGASTGRSRFIALPCNTCHFNAGANASFSAGSNRNLNFNTGVESVRVSSLASFPRDGGQGLTANPDGSFGNGTFNTPPLVEAADTGPFFHTATTVSGASAHNVGVANTIEEAIAFYDSPAFAASPSGQAAPINITATDIDNIGRFLRVVNAAFNIALARRRVSGVGTILNFFPPDGNPIVDELIRLSIQDARDAVRVLSGVSSLNLTAQGSLNRFISLAPAFGDPGGCGTVTADCSDSGGGNRVGELLSLLDAAATDLGTNLTFQIGQGTLMF